MKDQITYYKISDRIEGVYYKESLQQYPLHTHTNHAVIGLILNGSVTITENTLKCVYHAGEQFHLMPNIPHSIAPANHEKYSMFCLCIQATDINSVYHYINDYCMQLQNTMLTTPENPLSIDDMAKSINISPYHMIRTFKAAFGLTPHQFQIQSRIRKAQKLLENGDSITDVAYNTGFCDQSHFNRCFKKIVGLNPKEYQRSIKKLY